MEDNKTSLKETLIDYRKYGFDLPLFASLMTNALADNPWMSIVPVTVGCISAYSHNSEGANPLRRLFNFAASIATGTAVAFMVHNGLEANELSSYFTNVARDVISGFTGYSIFRAVNSLSYTQKPKPPV